MYLSALRDAAHKYVDIATLSELETLLGTKRVAAIRNNKQTSIVDTILSGNVDITSLPTPVLIELVKYVSLQDIKRLCAINREFRKRCIELDLEGRVYNRYNERAHQLTRIFMSHWHPQITFENAETQQRVVLDDKPGDSGFFIRVTPDSAFSRVAAPLLAIYPELENDEYFFGFRRWMEVNDDVDHKDDIADTLELVENDWINTFKSTNSIVQEFFVHLFSLEFEMVSFKDVYTGKPLRACITCGATKGQLYREEHTNDIYCSVDCQQ